MSLPPTIAWAGELMLLGATWSDRDGHMVKFKLVAPNETRPNPFKQFTKRKGGRGGTRFHATLAHVQGLRGREVVYDQQVMLAGWQDSSTEGYVVTFWCAPPELGRTHPFDGYTRKADSFMAALVELQDDETPVDQVKRDRVENDGSRVENDPPAEPAPEAAVEPSDDVPSEPVGGTPEPAGETPEPESGTVVRLRTPQRLSMVAAMMCDLPLFWEWIRTTQQTYVDSKDGAATWMRAQLRVDSRRKLDSEPDVQLRFHDQIRRPFVNWQYQMGHATER